MKVVYKINKGFIYEIPKYWDIKIINNIISIYIYNQIIVTAILIDKNIYIGYNNDDKYTIYYYE